MAGSAGAATLCSSAGRRFFRGFEEAIPTVRCGLLLEGREVIEPSQVIA